MIIIGGAYGVSEDVKNKSDSIWSLSKLVFPSSISSFDISRTAI